MPKLHLPVETRLSNGIPVIFQHYDGPVAATYWWVQTGSADEKPHEAGFAHFLEHMHFKDAAAKETGRASTGQTAQWIESLGGDINAYTSFDQTVYHVTCAAHHWERVIDVFSPMARPQRFLKTDFEREREVILEELRKNEDSPERNLFQSLFSTTYRKHPYGRPVIGFSRTLKAARLAQLESFYRRQYTPQKMGLILVGPLEDSLSNGEIGGRAKAILKKLERHFGSSVLRRASGASRSASPARAMESPLRKGAPQFRVNPFDVKTPSLALSFRVPGLKDPDIPALDLLAGILGMGETSRLYQRLFYQTSLVTEVSGSLYVPSDPGMLYLQWETEGVEKLAASAEEAFRVIRRLREEGPTAEELVRVVVNEESERLYVTQTADGLAGRLGFLKFTLGDLEFDRRYLEELRAVDPARIREVAAQYLVPERLSGTIQIPQEDKGFSATEIAQIAAQVLTHEASTGAVLAAGTPLPAGMKKGKGKERPKRRDVPEVIELPSGLKVAYYERPQSHVMSIHASAFGGIRMEIAHPIEDARKDWGSSYMMSLTWTKGTPSRDARGIAAFIEGRASSLDGFSGRNTVGVQTTGLSRDWGDLSRLFGDVLLNPLFPSDEVAHSRRVAEDTVRGIEDHSSQLCTKLFLESLFESHPYGKLTIGSPESIPGITSEKLAAFHRNWLRPNRMVISVSGAVKRSMLDLWLEELETALRAKSAAFGGEVLPLSLPDEPTLKAPRWVEKSLGREQLHIIVGGLGTRLHAEDRFAVRLLQTLLGGQSGRLFVELREKKSLAYTVAPLSFEGMERGYIGTYIACSPSKRDEAIAGIRGVLENLAAKGPTAAEMARAKEFFLGRRAMDLQSDPALAAHFGLETLYGIPILEGEAMVKKIQSIGAKEVRDVCRRYLVEPCMVTSVVG